MNLLQATELLKEFVNKNFSENNDLELFMHLCELVLIQYKATSKLPGRHFVFIFILFS